MVGIAAFFLFFSVLAQTLMMIRGLIKPVAVPKVMPEGAKVIAAVIILFWQGVIALCVAYLASR